MVGLSVVSAESFSEGWARKGVARDELPEQTLLRGDPQLAPLIEAVRKHAGLQRFQASSAASHFDALLRSLVYQQLSTKAAATIYGRVVEATGGTPTPEAVMTTSAERLRACGLSTQKLGYVKGLAERMASGHLVLEGIELADDAGVITQLTAIKGFGEWSAQMFLMFRLHRGDVMPTRDLGIQKGLAVAHGLRRNAAPGYIQRATLRWAPHRSIGALYLWAALELPQEIRVRVAEEARCIRASRKA